MLSLLLNPTYQTRDHNISSCKFTLQGMFSTCFCDFITMGSAESGWQVSSADNGCASSIDIARVLIWTCSLLSSQFLCLPVHSSEVGVFLNIAPRATRALAEYHVKAPSKSTDRRIGGNVPSETLESTCGMIHLGLFVSLSGVSEEECLMGISHIETWSKALEMPWNHSFYWPAGDRRFYNTDGGLAEENSEINLGFFRVVPHSCEMVWSSHTVWTLLTLLGWAGLSQRRDCREVRMYKGSITYREINVSAQGEHTNAKTAEDHLWHRYKRCWTGAYYSFFFLFFQKITEH